MVSKLPECAQPFSCDLPSRLRRLVTDTSSGVALLGNGFHVDEVSRGLAPGSMPIDHQQLERIRCKDGRLNEKLEAATRTLVKLLEKASRREIRGLRVNFLCHEEEYQPEEEGAGPGPMVWCERVEEVDLLEALPPAAARRPRATSLPYGE